MSETNLVRDWRCRRCGSSRWVAASLTGPVDHGGRAIKQCVPCGHYSSDPVEVSTQDAPSASCLPPQSDAEGSGVAVDVQGALGAQTGAQGALDESRCGSKIAHADGAVRQCVVDAVRPLLIAEGRRQAVEAIRARVGGIAAVEWAALIVEEEGRG